MKLSLIHSFFLMPTVLPMATAAGHKNSNFHGANRKLNVANPNTMTCQSQSDCTLSDQYCDFTSSQCVDKKDNEEDCSAYWECMSGACSEWHTGQCVDQCFSDSDCSGDYICSYVVDTDYKICQPNTCQYQSDCYSTDQYCDTSLSQCVDKKENSEACDESWECIGGACSAVENGQCVDQCFSDADCNAGEMCDYVIGSLSTTCQTIPDPSTEVYVRSSSDVNWCGHQIHRAGKCGGALARFDNDNEKQVLLSLVEGGWHWFNSGDLDNKQRIKASGKVRTVALPCGGNQSPAIYRLPSDYADATKYPDCDTSVLGTPEPVSA